MTKTARRCVTFDLWETLIFDDPDKDEARGRMRCENMTKILTDSGTDLTYADLKRGYEQSAVMMQSIWDKDDEVPIRDQITLMIRLANGGKEPSIDASVLPLLEDAYVRPVLTIPPRVAQDAADVLKAGKDRGYSIGLISNTGRSPGSALRQLLDNYGALAFFDVTVFSNEVHKRKPDRQIFDRAALLLQVERENIIHVGDNPRADYWGAKKAGMRALLLDQTTPDSSRWGPTSLFALNRMKGWKGQTEVEPESRIKSLSDSLERIEAAFA